ncbi:MAG: Rieske (2Fe-2S) protein [Rhodobacteraceae bacterium]|nr:Rieske (2Fe-2S) protein [Paracoccaceae bacterium]
MMPEPQFLCQLDEIEEGRSKGVAPNRRGRDRILLARRDGEVYGYVNTCPHYDRAPMAWKKDEFLNADGTRIMCASHGALFRIEDGVCEVGPCLGQVLRRVDVFIREGAVYGVNLPEEPKV